MKKFLKSLTFFLLPIFLTAIVAEIFLRKIPNDYRVKKQYLERHSKEIKVLFLGSSHAYYGINSTYIKEPSFNAAYVSQSLKIDYEILNQYKSSLKSLKAIILPISYFSLNSSMENNGEGWRNKYYNIYYHINLGYRPQDNLEILNKFSLSWYKIVNYYIKHINPVSSSSLGWGTHSSQNSTKSLEESGIEASSRHTHFDHIIYQENRIILDSMISIAERKNVRIIFYTPPAYYTYIKHLNVEQLRELRNTMWHLTEKYNNTTYIDFLADTSFAETDFFDADHLNDKGAKKLTTKLGDFINK